MKKYRVEARRSGRWWALILLDYPNFATQVRRLDQAADMAVHAFADGPEIEVTEDQIEIVPVLDSGLAVLSDAANARNNAATAAEKAMAVTRAAARQASDLGLTVRDIATLLDVTPSYVSKLLKSAA